MNITVPQIMRSCLKVFEPVSFDKQELCLKDLKECCIVTSDLELLKVDKPNEKSVVPNQLWIECEKLGFRGQERHEQWRKMFLETIGTYGKSEDTRKRRCGVGQAITTHKWILFCGIGYSKLAKHLKETWTQFLANDEEVHARSTELSTLLKDTLSLEKEVKEKKRARGDPIEKEEKNKKQQGTKRELPGKADYLNVFHKSGGRKKNQVEMCVVKQGEHVRYCSLLQGGWVTIDITRSSSGATFIVTGESAKAEGTNIFDTIKKWLDECGCPRVSNNFRDVALMREYLGLNDKGASSILREYAPFVEKILK